MTESLAGRFEVIPVMHWSLVEMRAAFGWGVEEYIDYGGCPGAAGLIGDFDREVDYLLVRGREIVAIEVKSGRPRDALPGMQALSDEFRLKRKLLVGPQGIPPRGFLAHSPRRLV